MQLLLLSLPTQLPKQTKDGHSPQATARSAAQQLAMVGCREGLQMITPAAQTIADRLRIWRKIPAGAGAHSYSLDWKDAGQD